ncbi:MAG: hypothetical protein QF709_00650 [Candidatus Thalassarchaeum sp.]|jgi:hypothetical protein|nr:hypothetical protein [Candidatus Thalassarchaeum sp.]MDP6920410.1 hypothetical protein [Candidatus Thalassarchaeum sp.]
MKEFRINMSDEPGSLAEHCEAIASGDVNILAIVAIAGDSASAAILTDNADATISALDRMGADYSVSELKSAKMEHKPGSLAAFTRGMANSGVNLRSLYVMSMDGESATIGYTTE